MTNSELFEKQNSNNIEGTQKNLNIPVIEEHIVVDKKIEETGKFKISKHVSENIETVNIPLLHNEHYIEHKEINMLVDDLPSIRHEGDTIIIPVIKEVLVKRILLVEEIRITQRTLKTNEQQQIKLRKENVTVERS